MRPGSRCRAVENKRRPVLSQYAIAQARHFKVCRNRLCNVQEFTPPMQF
jgi:hypothetical protein